MLAKDFTFKKEYTESLIELKQKVPPIIWMDMVWNFILYGATGEFEIRDEEVKNYISCMFKVTDLDFCIIDGEIKVGRKKIEVNEDMAIALKEQLGSWKEVAKILGITENTLRARRKEWAENG